MIKSISELDNSNGKKDTFKAVKQLTDRFAGLDGRRPRIMIASSNTTSVFGEVHRLSNGLADLGFDVDIATRMSSARSLFRQAAESDVHVVALVPDGLASDLLTDLLQHMKKQDGRPIPLVVISDLPVEEGHLLMNSGLATVLNPSLSPAQLGLSIMQVLGTPD